MVRTLEQILADSKKHEPEFTQTHIRDNVPIYSDKPHLKQYLDAIYGDIPGRWSQQEEIHQLIARVEYGIEAPPDLISPKKYIAPLLGTWKESVGAWYYSQVVLGYDPIDKTPIDSIETRKTAYNELVKLFLGFDPISLNKVDHPVQIEEFRKSINNKTHGIGFFNTFLANKELPRQYIDFFKHDYLPLVSHIPSKYIHHPDITNHLSKTYSNLTGGGTSFGDT